MNHDDDVAVSIVLCTIGEGLVGNSGSMATKHIMIVQLTFLLLGFMHWSARAPMVPIYL